MQYTYSTLFLYFRPGTEKMDGKKKRRRSLRLLKSAPVVYQEEEGLGGTDSSEVLGSVWLTGQRQMLLQDNHGAIDPGLAAVDSAPSEEAGTSFHTVHAEQSSYSSCYGLCVSDYAVTTSEQDSLPDSVQPLSCQSLHQCEEDEPSWTATVTREVTRGEDSETSLNSAFVCFEQSPGLNESADMSCNNSSCKQPDYQGRLSSGSPGPVGVLDTSVPTDSLDQNIDTATPTPSPLLALKTVGSGAKDIPWISKTEPDLSPQQSVNSGEIERLDMKSPVISASPSAEVSVSRCVAAEDSQDTEPSIHCCVGSQTYCETNFSECNVQTVIVGEGSKDRNEGKLTTTGSEGRGEEEVRSSRSESGHAQEQKTRGSESRGEREQRSTGSEDGGEEPNNDELTPQTEESGTAVVCLQPETVTNLCEQDSVYDLQNSQSGNYSYVCAKTSPALAVPKKSSQKKQRRRSAFGADLRLESFIYRDSSIDSDVNRQNEQKILLQDGSSSNNTVDCLASDKSTSSLHSENGSSVETICAVDMDTGKSDSSLQSAKTESTLGQTHAELKMQSKELTADSEPVKKKKRKTVNAVVSSSRLSADCVSADTDTSVSEAVTNISEFQPRLTTGFSNQDPVHDLQNPESNGNSQLCAKINPNTDAVKKSKQKKQRRRSALGVDSRLEGFTCHSSFNDTAVLGESGQIRLLQEDSSNNNDTVDCLASSRFTPNTHSKDRSSVETISAVDLNTGVADCSLQSTNTDSGLGQTLVECVEPQMSLAELTTDSEPVKKKKRRRTAEEVLLSGLSATFPSNCEETSVNENESTNTSSERSASRRRRSSLRLYRQQKVVTDSTVVSVSGNDMPCNEDSDIQGSADVSNKQNLQVDEGITNSDNLAEPQDVDSTSIPSELEHLYHNKNYRKPANKTWETIFELPSRGKLTSKQKQKRYLQFEDHVPMSKLKRRWNKAIKNGWNATAKPATTKQDVLEKLRQLDKEMSEIS